MFSLFPCLIRLEVDLLPRTPINIDRLEQELIRHPDRSFVNFLISGLRKGFHTGIQGIPDHTLHGENLRSARKHPDVVSKLLGDPCRKYRSKTAG